MNFFAVAAQRHNVRPRKDKMRVLSSGWTWFYKFIFPTVWIGGFGFGTLMMFLAPDSFSGDDVRGIRDEFLTILVLGSALIYWSCIRVKRVSIDLQLPRGNSGSVAGC